MTYAEFIRRVHAARVALDTARIPADGYVIRVHPEDWEEVCWTVPGPSWAAHPATGGLLSAMGLPIAQDKAMTRGQIVLRREVAA